MNNRSHAVILLVEDDPGDQELIRRALAEADVAHELHVVEDGAAALDVVFCRGHYARPGTWPAPDLILLDFNLPKLNAIQVLRQLKQDAQLRRTPVIVLSTSQQEKDVRQCYDAGASSYVVKPVLLDDFTRIIRRICEYWFTTVRLCPAEECTCPPST